MNKRKLPLEFPCRCGHAKKMHGWAGISIGDEWCNGFSTELKRPNGSPCDCMSFVSDNLKYLEKCLQKRGKLK